MDFILCRRCNLKAIRVCKVMWVTVCHRMVVCKAEVRRPLKRVRSRDLWL